MGVKSPLLLPKSDRLCQIKLIEDLYLAPSIIKSYPLIFSFKTPAFKINNSFQIMFTAPKRNFKLAVDRNRVKRILRDRFRLLKPQFIQALQEQNIICAITYTSKELPHYQQIDSAILKIISKLQNENRQ